MYFACSPGEVSDEHAKLRHGVFSHHVIQALGGAADKNREGVVTLNELVRFTNQGVGNFMDAELDGEVQTPVLLSAVAGSVALVDTRSNTH